MKTYKLIKTYPGSPATGFILDKSWEIKVGTLIYATHYVNNSAFNPVNYPEYWKEIVKKDYEILSFYNKEGNSYYTVKSENYFSEPASTRTLDYCLLYYKIHSVKRLSDDEIFTIGDRIIVNDFTNKICIINCISSINNNIKFDYENLEGCTGHNQPLNELVKFKQPLFTTEDGVDMFDADRFYICGIDDWKAKACRASPSAIFSTDRSKKFSTKEKAEAYILMNKPCLSLNDYYSVFDEDIRDYGISAKLKKLVKTKL
jgi:hypothetical protein